MKNKQVEFTTEEEIEVSCSITPFYKGASVMSYSGPTPDEDSEVEDLYVGVIICGKSIDITSLLNNKQLSYFEEKCFEELGDHLEKEMDCYD